MFQAMSRNMKHIFMRMDFLVNLSIFVFPVFAQEASCTQKCNGRGRCQFDYVNRRYSCNCEVPYDGEYCENTQGMVNA